jgi:hypothetical protein
VTSEPQMIFKVRPAARTRSLACIS